MAPISGSFKNSPKATGYVPKDNTRNWGTGVDPGHDRADMPDLGTPPPVRHAKLLPPEYIEDYYDPERDEPPYFALKDQEPAHFDDPDQHDVETLPWGVPDNDRLRQISGRLHSIRRGAQWAYRTASMVDRDVTTRNVTERLQSLPPGGMPQQGGPITGGALRALRGFNSLPVNNPGSPDVSYSGNYTRQGWEISRWTNRRMGRRGISHTKRQLHVNVAATAIDTPPHPGPYSSPFASYGDFAVGMQRPAQRREPRPWDEDQVEDYSGEPDTGDFVVWGL
jgi:hypothetical protein